MHVIPLWCVRRGTDSLMRTPVQIITLVPSGATPGRRRGLDRHVAVHDYMTPEWRSLVTRRFMLAPDELVRAADDESRKL